MRYPGKRQLASTGPASHASGFFIVGFPFENWERLADDLETLSAVGAARQDLAGHHSLHFPVAFPEVLLRTRPGYAQNHFT